MMFGLLHVFKSGLIGCHWLSLGNMGDVKAVGEGISEMRIDYGPGYRVYFKKSGRHVVLLLCGGNKSSQDADIKAAKHMAKDL